MASSLLSIGTEDRVDTSCDVSLYYLQGYMGGVDEDMSLDSIHRLLTAVIVGKH